MDYSTFLLLSDGACETGWPIISRQIVDSASGVTMASPDKPFLCNGHVTTWRYLAKKSNAFQAIVLRPIDGSTARFLVVGVNNIPAGATNTPVTYIVPSNQRILVKAGDVIGWSFGYSVLAFSYGGVHRVRWLYNLYGSLQANQDLDINSGGQAREYSIAATVGEVSEPGE